MALLPLVTSPDPRLNQPSETVPEVTDEIRELMDNMLETMYHEEGIGLAAVQVGVMKRVIVMDVSIDEPEPLYMVNPEVVESSEDLNEYDEGCLSFPGIRNPVERPKTVTIKYLDYDGKEQLLECDGLLATCVQHEIDHTKGQVFVNYASKMKRDILIKKVQKYKKMHHIE